MCFRRGTQSNLDLLSSGIDTPQVETKAQVQIATKQKLKVLADSQQGGKAYRHEDK